MKTHTKIENYIFLYCDKTKQQLSATGSAEDDTFSFDCQKLSNVSSNKLVFSATSLINYFLYRYLNDNNFSICAVKFMLKGIDFIDLKHSIILNNFH